MLTKPAHSFSTLQAVHLAASAGSFTHLTDADFILDRRVVGGMQSVSQAMAAPWAATCTWPRRCARSAGTPPG